MELQLLDFDISEGADGSVVFDAMASVPAARLAALHAEVLAVLAWAQAAFPGARAPLEDGGEWDFQLDGALEQRIPQALHWDGRHGTLTATDGAAGAVVVRHALNLSISGSPAFAELFREAFGIG